MVNQNKLRKMNMVVFPKEGEMCGCAGKLKGIASRCKIGSCLVQAGKDEPGDKEFFSGTVKYSLVVIGYKIQLRIILDIKVPTCI